MKLEIIKPFGPSIVKLQIPEEIITEINKYTDEIIKDDVQSKELDHGSKLVGNVHQEILLRTDFMQKIKWAEFLANSCQKWLFEGHNISIKKFDIIASWIIQQYKNDYNPIHYHSGQISGVGYLKVPETLGENIQNDKTTNENGKLQLIHGSVSLLSHATHLIKPEVGDFYLFPNYLMHTVYPFSGTDEERRSVSFNAKLDFSSIKL